MNETPKNVRQVGNIDNAHKIYVEDYVITFTKSTGDSLVSDNNAECAAAVLLGHKKNSNKEVETYINGMVLIDGFSLSKDTVFSNEMWSGIYDKIKEFYEDEEIVGWLYIGCLNNTQPDRKLINIHSSNFSGKNLVFMVYDCEEKEELFFDFINNSFVKRRGFYIYYQKNDTMHNYMLASSNKAEEKNENEDRVVKDIRSILSKRQEKGERRKVMQTAYAAGMLVAAVILLVGTSVIYRNNIISDRNNTSQTVSDDVTDKETDASQDMANAYGATQIPGEPSADESQTADNSQPVSDGNQTADNSQPVSDGNQTADNSQPVSDGNQTADNSQPVSDGNQTADNSQPVSDGNQPADSSQVADSQTPGAGELNQATEVKGMDDTSSDDTPVMSDNTTSKYSFYIVKNGDNLGSISEKIFKSVKYVKKIKELNDIEDEDLIYEGQKLWIPEK